MTNNYEVLYLLKKKLSENIEFMFYDFSKFYLFIT